LAEPLRVFRAVGNGWPGTPVLISTGEADKNRFANELTGKKDREGRSISRLHSAIRRNYSNAKAMCRINRFSARGIEYADAI
jgi:hypothetical protein